MFTNEVKDKFVNVIGYGTDNFCWKRAVTNKFTWNSVSLELNPVKLVPPPLPLPPFLPYTSVAIMLQRAISLDLSEILREDENNYENETMMTTSMQRMKDSLGERSASRDDDMKTRFRNCASRGYGKSLWYGITIDHYMKMSTLAEADGNKTYTEYG